mmetsp:Transcript_104998/g.165745  ORF Transcript_104998/g.165745 Transcript_104998/m.165745 type:complete len:109 (-) Transcript_104998:69-395(-)
MSPKNSERNAAVLVKNVALALKARSSRSIIACLCFQIVRVIPQRRMGSISNVVLIATFATMGCHLARHEQWDSYCLLSCLEVGVGSKCLGINWEWRCVLSDVHLAASL